MMEKSIIRIVLYFGVVNVLLPRVYTAVTDNVNNNHDSPTIMDKIRSDSNLCPSARDISLSNITEVCTRITYPEKGKEINIEEIDTLLCLGAYDAWYKYCYYSSFQSIHPYNNVTEFQAAMQKYIPSYEKDKMNEKQQDFCRKLVGLKTTSSLFNPPLQKFFNLLNNTGICSSFCFNSNDGKFRKPLCAILAWSNELDHNNTVRTTHDVQPNLSSAINQKPDAVPLKKSDENEKIKQSSNDNNAGSDIPVTDKDSVDKLKTTQLEHTVKESLKDDGQSSHPSGNDNEGKEKVSSAASSPDVLKPSTQKKLQQPENNVQEQVEHPQPNPAAEQPGDTKNTNESVDFNGNNPQEEEHTDNKKLNDNDIKSPDGALDNTHGHEETDSEDYIHPGSVSEHYNQDDETLIDRGMENNENNENDPMKRMQKSFDNENQSQVISRYPSIKADEESHFYTYFTVMSVISILGYVGYHHKQKILAILLEGRRSRGNRGRRRPSTASYRKLDCTLEEAVTSQCNANVTHVIY